MSLNLFLVTFSFFLDQEVSRTYRIRPIHRTDKQYRSLQIIASVIVVYFFIKAYVVGTHLNCIDLSMQFK